MSSMCITIKMLLHSVTRPAMHSSTAPSQSKFSSRCRAAPQVYCYEDSKLLKLFATVVRILYDFDVLGEDTIKAWYKKGTQPKVRVDELLVS